MKAVPDFGRRQRLRRRSYLTTEYRHFITEDGGFGRVHCRATGKPYQLMDADGGCEAAEQRELCDREAVQADTSSGSWPELFPRPRRNRRPASPMTR
jgi:hypothetical protein